MLAVAGAIATLFWINPRHAFAEGRPDALESPCYKETNYFCIKVLDPDPTDPHQIASLVLDHLIHSYNSLNDPRTSSTATSRCTPT